MIYNYKNDKPQIDEETFIAPTSVIIGQATVNRACSIWYGAVIRADENKVVIGPKTNIQEGVIIHESKTNPTIVGEGVTIGHRAVVHGAQIGDYTLIGMGAIILDGAKIGRHCIIGANSLITSNTVIEEGMLVLGSPAKAIRALNEEQIRSIYDSAEHYIQLAKAYK
ncbi:MAG: gamma carbonic anhydrase family protein [Cellulosilyticaceae bacterium]